MAFHPKFEIQKAHIDAYLSGFTLTEVGALAGVSHNAIRDALMKRGLLRTAAQASAIAQQRGRLHWTK